MFSRVKLRRLGAVFLAPVLLLAVFAPALPASAASGLPTCPTTGIYHSCVSPGVLTATQAYPTTVALDPNPGHSAITVSVPSNFAMEIKAEWTTPIQTTANLTAPFTAHYTELSGLNTWTLPTGTAQGASIAVVPRVASSGMVNTSITVNGVVTPLSVPGPASLDKVSLAQTAGLEDGIVDTPGHPASYQGSIIPSFVISANQAVIAVGSQAPTMGPVTVPADDTTMPVAIKFPATFAGLTVTTRVVALPANGSFMLPVAAYVFGGSTVNFAPVAVSAPKTPKKTVYSPPTLKIVGPATMRTGVPTRYTTSPATSVTWSTNRPWIGVSTSGVLYAFAPSTVILTATAKDGRTASTTVTALPLVLSIQGPSTLSAGKAATYRVTGVPTGMQVQWSAWIGGHYYRGFGTHMVINAPAGSRPFVIQANVQDGQSVARLVSVQSGGFPWWFVGVLIFALLMLLAAEIRRRRATRLQFQPSAEAEAEAS